MLERKGEFMGSCCDPNAPKIYMLNVGGELLSLVGLEQAFLDISSLDITNEKVAEKLLEIVGRRNFMAQGTEEEYKIALLAEYKKFLTRK